MDHMEPAKPGGTASNLLHNQSSIDSKQHQHVAYSPQQPGIHASYGFNPTQPSCDGNKIPGFVGLEVNNLSYPYNPYPSPYVVQQVQGQGYPMLHHAVAQETHHPTFPDPPPPYMQQHLLNQQPTQRVIIKEVSHKSSYCSWRKLMVGVFFTLLALKLIIACVW
uniref:Uncharacterized protein n=1 Tax=Lygus hesperus TaxID=30085 RepID=A0A146LS78_LYGHE